MINVDILQSIRIIQITTLRKIPELQMLNIKVLRFLVKLKCLYTLTNIYT